MFYSFLAGMDVSLEMPFSSAIMGLYQFPQENDYWQYSYSG
jgi:hypothetical protein